LASVVEVPVEKVSVIAVIEGFGRLPFSVGTQDGMGTPGGGGEAGGGRRRLRHGKRGGTRARGGGGEEPSAAMHERDRGNADTGRVGGGGGGAGSHGLGGDGYGWYCTVVLDVKLESDREEAVVTLLRSEGVEVLNNAFRAAGLPQVCVLIVLSCV
jgi:hypothetical protein